MDLEVGEAVVLQNSNKLALRLLPCDSFARTAPVGRELADFEVGVAQRLAAVSAPIASLDARVNPRVHVRDGFLETLHGAGQPIRRSGHIDQLLHGEPHPGNLLSTTEGLLFIDFETCCRGPIEFDVAHVPEAVSVHYPGVEKALLQECRRLVLAMVAAWRWDVRDEFPNGHRAAVQILAVLRGGPPWPSLGALSTD